jgi:hypothetical protein
MMEPGVSLMSFFDRELVWEGRSSTAFHSSSASPSSRVQSMGTRNTFSATRLKRLCAVFTLCVGSMRNTSAGIKRRSTRAGAGAGASE